MEWRDCGFVLATRRHGESALIVELLTAEHGRHAGLVRGGQSPRRRALFQPGNGVAVVWRGRLAEQLGSYDCELTEAHAAGLLDDPDRLAALNAATALLLAAVPEREPHPEIHASLGALLRALAVNPLWPQAYVRWECDLLGYLGYGLDLTRCAATGATDNLTHVSPRTGRAVSAGAAAPYRDKLFPLPAFLWCEAAATPADIAAGMNLARHFLLHHLLLPQGGKLPEGRERFAERMRRHAASGMIAGN